MTLLLNESEFIKHINIEDVLPGLEKAYQEIAKGKQNVPPRTAIKITEYDGYYVNMQAYLPQLGVMGSKGFTDYTGNPKKGLPKTRYVYLLNDALNGELLAIANGLHLTNLRTSAVAMIATKYMSISNISRAAVFGAGNVAEYQIIGLGTVYPGLEVIYVYDYNPEKASRIRDKLQNKIKPRIIIAETPHDAVFESEIIITATSSPKPVFASEDIKPGTHINAIGAITPTTREIPGDIVARARIVSQSKRQILGEAGDFLIPLKEGKITEDAFHAELHEVISGGKPGRVSPEEITLFKSVGFALEDIVVLKLVYDISREKGLGIEVDI